MARITPAAKAFVTKKKFVSGFNDGKKFPSNGKRTPITPATRTEGMAAILYFVAPALFPSSSSCKHSHLDSPADTAMRRREMKEKKSKILTFFVILIVTTRALLKF